MFSQVDVEGNWHVLFQEIDNHRYNGTEVKEQGAFIPKRTGTKCRIEKNRRVEVLIQWKDGSTTWVTVKDMKNSYPVRMKTFAVQRCISGDPEFACWIQHVVEKGNRIIGKMKSIYWV